MEHVVTHITVIIAMFMLVVLVAFLNFASWTGVAPANWFNTRIISVYEKFYLEVMPAPWTFQIWAVIFSYQFIWGAYALSLLCRKTNDGQGYLYYRPGFMPVGLYLTYMINLLLDIGWIFTFDREMFRFSSPIMFGISITLYICLGLSYYYLNKHGGDLLRLGHLREIKLVRTLVQNGMAMYGTWVTVTSVINICVTLTYVVGISQRDSSTACLGILMVEIIAYTMVDLFIIDRSSRYTFTPYITIIYALSGILHRVSAVGGRNLTLTIIAFIMSIIALLMKIIIVVLRNRIEPEPIRLHSAKPTRTMNTRV